MSANRTRDEEIGRANTRDVILTLVARDFKLRYKKALLGWLWAVAVPLVRLLVLTFVFTRIVPLGIENYGAFLFSGLIAWMWFAQGVAATTTSPLDNSDLLYRPGLVREDMPVISALTSGIEYLAALPILLVYLAVTTGIPATIVFLPLVLAVQLVMILAIGYPFALANVYFRDVKLFVDVGLLLGFYLTPVFYDLETVPAEYQTLLNLNPMTHLVNAHRAILIEGTTPDLWPFGLVAIVALLIALVGRRAYRRASATFVDHL